MRELLETFRPVSAEIPAQREYEEAQREPRNAIMYKITITTEFYNEKRYGEPYVALCDAQAKVLTWGTWLGTPGNSGRLLLDLPAGVHIVMIGQKDHHGSGGDLKYSVYKDGTLIQGPTRDKFSAVEAYEEATSASDKALRAERVKLMARIVEIDAILAAAHSAKE